MQIDLSSYAAPLALIAVSTVLLVAPIWRYVRLGWKYKSQDITNSISTDAKRIYLEKFPKFPAEKITDPEQQFQRLYLQRFGRHHFYSPIFLIAILSLVLFSLAVESFADLKWKIWNNQITLNETALAGLAGAYMWGR